MDYTQRATLSRKVKNVNLFIICAVGSISALGIVMAAYSLIKSEILFAVVYALAFILGFSYVVMKINSIMPTYIERSGDEISVQNWENGFFPFVPEKGFFAEFIPAKSAVRSMAVKDISKICIGSRNYLLKTVSGGEFFERLKSYRERYDNILKHMEFLYIKSSDGEEMFLSVTDYDEAELIEILKPIVEENEKIDFKCGSRRISKAIPPKKLTF